MSVATRVAERYARALVLEGQATNSLDELYKDVLLVRETASQSRDLVLLWNSPVVSPEKKEAIITKIFSGKVSNTLLNFFKLMILKGRENCSRATIHRFIEMYQELNGISKVYVTSATDLDENTKNSIVSSLSKSLGKTIELSQSVDPSLIGGIVIRNQDNQLDLSVKTALNRVKQNLL